MIGLIVGLLVGLALALAVALVRHQGAGAVHQQGAAAHAGAGRGRGRAQQQLGSQRAAGEQAGRAAPRRRRRRASAVPPPGDRPRCRRGGPRRCRTGARPARPGQRPSGARAPAASASRRRSAKPGGRSVHLLRASGRVRQAEDAEQQRAKLAMLGCTAKVTEREQGGRTMYRVRIGPFQGGRGRSGAGQAAGRRRDAALVRVER